MCPGDAVVADSVAPIKGGLVEDFAVAGAAFGIDPALAGAEGHGGGQGVVYDFDFLAIDGGLLGFGVVDVFPSDDSFLFVTFAGQADAGQPFAGGEDDASVFVIVGFPFVLLHDGELDAVEGDQFVEGEAQGQGGEHVDFDEGLAAGVVGAQGAGALPGGGEVGEEAVVEAGIVGFAPAVADEGGVKALGPEVGVGGGKAVEGEGTKAELKF